MRSLWKVSITLLITFSLLLPAGLWASEKKPEAKTTVAEVNNAPIYKKDFDLAYSHFENQIKSRGQVLDANQEKEIKNKVLENLIDAELLYQASQKSKLTIDEGQLSAQWTKIKDRMGTDEKFKANIEKMNYSDDEIKDQLKHQMYIQKFLADTFIDPASVSEDEVKAYYDGNPNTFQRPEQVQASHILIKVEPATDEAKNAAALKQIKEIQKKIKDGEDFSTLATTYSQCPSSKKGGDLGYFGRGQMVKPFEDAAFAMEVGQVSDIVQTSFGYHLIKLTGKRAASTTSLEEAREQIQNFLKQQKIQQAIAKFVADEKGKAKVERFLQ